MKETISIREHPYYTQGRHDGFKEGYAKATEFFMDEFEKARARRPIVFVIDKENAKLLEAE